MGRWRGRGVGRQGSGPSSVGEQGWKRKRGDRDKRVIKTAGLVNGICLALRREEMRGRKQHILNARVSLI